MRLNTFFGVSRRRMPLVVVSAALELVLAAGPQAAAAPAAPTFTVNSPFDVPANLADTDYTVCRTATNNSTCTLRAAIMKANRYSGGGVTIVIPNGVYTLTIAPASPYDDRTGDLNITQTMTLLGAGAAGTIVDANGLDRIFYVNQAVTAVIRNLTIRHGFAEEGGGIQNYGNLTLTGSTVSDNSSTAGGGISTRGDMTMDHDRIESNNAHYNGGGLYIHSESLTHIGFTSISGNRSDFHGAGIIMAGTATIDSSTVNGNVITTTGQNGGGFFNTGDLTVNNSTISANSATGYGGGLYNYTGATAVLYHVTIAGNIANSDRSGMDLGGGLQSDGSGQMANSLLAENYTASTRDDCDGTIESQDYNYIQHSGVCILGYSQPHDRGGAGDVWLGPLADYGGATFTRALLPGSPAVDNIPTSACRDSFGTVLPADQRGVARPVAGACDSGAYEGLYNPGLYGRNLVRNGDAESGGPSPNGADIGVPNWNETSGGSTVIDYDAHGGFPDPATDPVPAQRGYNFFAGGPAGSSVITQVITVTAISGAIDAGQVNYLLSADLGGYFDQSDAATLSAYFRNQSGATIGGPQVIGPVTVDDRGLHTGFQFRSHTGRVPANTRTILVQLNMTAGFGYNDAYADNLSLLLTPVVRYLFLPLIKR